MTQHTATLDLAAYGAVRADLASIAALRKALPPWAPEGTAGHFLKHADEQTVVAVAAVDRAVQSLELSGDRRRDWTIIAAPQFIGRIAGAGALARFSRGGGPAISPHLIPQHSLHSVSGALSILLAIRAPNFGVGGDAQSLADGLFAALTLPAEEGRAGTWLVATAWEPQPTVDREGHCTNQPVCYAASLALTAAAPGASLGRLRLTAGAVHVAPAGDDCPLTVPRLCELLDRRADRRLRWRLPWGATIALERFAPAPRLRAAA
jgi:hypothetical protein